MQLRTQSVIKFDVASPSHATSQHITCFPGEAACCSSKKVQRPMRAYKSDFGPFKERDAANCHEKQ